MRSPSIFVIALLLQCGHSSAARAQRNNAYRVGVSRQQVFPRSKQEPASRDTVGVTPTIEDRTSSDVTVGAIAGGVVGVAITLLAYQACTKSSPWQSDTSHCGIALIVVAPAAIGGGAIIGGLLGRVHAANRH